MKAPNGFGLIFQVCLMVFSSVAIAEPQELGCRLQIGDPDVFRVAQMIGPEQQSALRGLLVARRDQTESLFYYGNRLHTSLRALVQDAQVGEAASWLLSLISLPEDIKALIDSPPKPTKAAFSSRWAYGVAASSLHPTTDAEWTFLRRCALNEYKDRWVDAGAIQSLKLIASSRSRELLAEVRAANADRVSSATRALKYIDSEPIALCGPNPQVVAERLASALGAGTWKGNGLPRCNEMADKALVDLSFEVGFDRLIYTATFHKADGEWCLYGVREIMQFFVSSPGVVLKPKKKR